MKRGIALVVFCYLILQTTFAQQRQVQKDPVGTWKFSIPGAPEGYKNGFMDVKLADKKYSASMLFTDYNQKFIGDKVSVVKDSLLFTMYTEGQEVTIWLKMTGPLNMEGKALYSEGELILTMIKENSGR